MRPALGFSERYRLARIRNAAVLLDLETGSYFAVRGTAVVVCRALLANSDVNSAATRVAKSFDVSRETAKRDIDAFLVDLRRHPSSSRRSEVRVRAHGYELRGLDGGSLTIAHDGTVRTREAGSNLLRVAAPHVLALRGETILHASAILHGGRAIAFVAASGTGKTTIAKLLHRSGQRVLSEDLVALDARLRVRNDGEHAIRAWSRSRARAVSEDPLAACAKGTSPLAAVMLAQRVEGLEHVKIERVEKIAGVAALFENAFVELPASRVWERALEVSRRLVARGIVFAMSVPEGRRPLATALREWSARGFPRR